MSRPEDDNPFAKYNYTRRKRQSDIWIRLAKIGGAVLFFGLILLIYKSSSVFVGKQPPNSIMIILTVKSFVRMRL